MTLTDETLLGALGTVLDAVAPVPDEVLADARAALTHRTDPILATIQDAITVLGTRGKLPYGWRKLVAAALKQAADRERNYRSGRRHDGAPAMPEPGDEAYLAFVVASALTAQPAEPRPRTAASDLPECGSMSGYEKHRSLGEAPCAACRAANVAVKAAQKAAGPTGRRNLEPIPHGTYKGYKRHLYRKIPPCEPCMQASRDYQAGRAAKGAVS